MRVQTQAQKVVFQVSGCSFFLSRRKEMNLGFVLPCKVLV